MDDGGRLVTGEARIVIGRPIDEVFAFVADPLNDPKWCPTVRDPEQIGGNAPIVGAEYRFLHKPGPPKYAPITARIMELDSPRRFAARSEDAHGFYEFSYELEPVDGGTQITHRTESHFTSFLRFFAPLLKGHLRKMMTGQLQNLKTLLEDQPE